jgi:hypothetical protein
MTLRSTIETAAQRQLSLLKTGRQAIPPPQALQAAVGRLRDRFGGGLRAVVSHDRINRAVQNLRELGVGGVTARDRIVLAYNLAAPVAALGGRTLIDEPHLVGALVDRWSRDARDGTLRGLVWRGLYRSYLQAVAGEAATRLRGLLLQALPGVLERSRRDPPWLRTVRRHQALLGELPCRLYVAELLDGRRALLDELTLEFSPPPGSWFWELLVQALGRQLERLGDEPFRNRIPWLLSLTAIEGLMPRRDDLLAMILDRYARSGDPGCHEPLRDFALEHWKNPQLRSSLKWDLVAESTRQMVAGWLAWEDLEDFFRLCQDGGQPDESRLQYWLRFRHQITFSQVVIGAALDRSTEDAIVKFRERRAGRLARLLRATEDTNALIMRIGEWVFVVFSAQGGDCYPYRQDSLPMQLGSPTYFLHELRNRMAMVASEARTFPHLREWQIDFDDTLRFWGIRPDQVRRAVTDG